MAFGLIVGPIVGGHLAKYDVKVCSDTTSLHVDQAL